MMTMYNAYAVSLLEQIEICVRRAYLRLYSQIEHHVNEVFRVDDAMMAQFWGVFGFLE